MEEKGYAIVTEGQWMLGGKEEASKAFDVVKFICGLEKRGYSVEFVPIEEEEGYVAVKVQIKYFDKESGKMYVKGFLLSEELAKTGEFMSSLLRMLEMGERSVERKLEQVREEEKEKDAAKEE